MIKVKHSDSCKMVFGRKDPSCPRCQELIKGAAPIKWANSRKEQDAQFLREVRAHNCAASGCIICTFGDY